MKKISLLAFAASLFLLTSCEDDDKPNFVSPNYLAGEWDLTDIGELSSIPEGALVDYTSVAGTCDEGDKIIFGEQINTTFSAEDFTTNGEDCDLSSTNGTYELNGRAVTLSSDEVSSTWNVITLTFEVLEISYFDSETNELVFHKYKKKSE